MTKKDYCDHETCVALRELGYDAPQRLLVDYFGVYDEPQYDESIHLYDAQKFLREEKDIIIRVIPIYDLSTPLKGMTYTYEIIYWEVGYVEDECIEEYPTFEEALNDGIKEAVKLLQEEK